MVKKWSALLREITSKHDGDFYFLNCLPSWRTKDRLIKLENVCKDHDYSYVEMPQKDNNILKYNYGEKSMKVPFIIYSDMQPLLEKLEKMTTWHNNPKNSSTSKINKHTVSGYSLFTHPSFDATKNKLDCYTAKDYEKVL